MGDARQRRSLREQVIQAFPHCIYCGGTSPASTLDHVPPRAVFNLRHRPRGLEFPACSACNGGARLDELVAAMLSRCYPDPKTAQGKREAEAIFQAVNNNCPGLLAEMVATPRQQEIAALCRDHFSPGAGVINCRGPLLNRAIHRFGAKIGFALHFQITKKPVPLDGGACVWWLTNYQAVQGDMPHELLAVLGEPSTLRQGSWEVGDQFRYASRATEEGTMSAHYATFRSSFAVCVFVADREDKVHPPVEADHVSVYRPGWLQTNVG